MAAALAGMILGLPLWLFPGLRSVVRFTSRSASAPYQRLGDDAADVSGFITAWLRSGSVYRENLQLRERVETLEMKLTASTARNAEFIELSEMLGFERSYTSLVVAEVLSSGGSDGWSRRIRIGCGTNRGVTPGATVIASGGLVGRVIEVSGNTSDVLLITDINSNVACSFDPDIPSARGILTGGGMNTSAGAGLKLLHTVEPLTVNYMNKDISVTSGVQVVTSGMGGTFPRGLPVGLVIASEPDRTGLYQRAEVRPFVDFSSLRYVGVIIQDGGGVE